MGLIYALIATGLSLIFGLMDIVNFAHGEHLMFPCFHLFGLVIIWNRSDFFNSYYYIVDGTLWNSYALFLIRYILKAKMLIQILQHLDCQYL